MDGRMIFFMGEKWVGLKDGSPPAGSRGIAQVGSGGEAPEADDNRPMDARTFVKIMHC